MRRLIQLVCLLMMTNGAAAQLGLKPPKSKKSKTKVEIDYSQQRFAPVPEYQSLISNMRLDPQKGLFKCYGTINLYFLPKKDKQGNDLKYNTVENDASQMLLWADIVKVGSGDVVATFHFAADIVNRISTPVYVKNGYGSKNPFVTETVLKQAGAYEMRFYLAGDHFYTYAFEVIETESDDPYSPVEAIYTLGGLWENQALIQVNEGDKAEQSELRFQPIISYRGIHVRSGRQDLKLDAEAERQVLLKKEGEVIGTFYFKENDGDDLFGEKYVPAFEKFNLRVGGSELTSGLYPFQKVPRNETVGERLVMIKDLTDGDYEIEMTVKGMSDRADFIKTYGFSVSQGRVQFPNRSNRKTYADKLTFIDSGRDYLIIDSK